MLGHWCPTCSRERVAKYSVSRRIGIEAMKVMAEKRGGKCLSENYLSQYGKLRWRCKFGHEWEAVPYSIKAGRWCPTCSEGIKERACRGIFEVLFARKFPKAHPSWLRNEAGNVMELDGYCSALHLAFEYHGEQHYMFIEHFHDTHAALRSRKANDVIKREVCRKHGVNLIEIPYRISILRVEAFVRKLCAEKGIKIPRKTAVDIDSLQVWRVQAIEEYQELAKERGGKLLSKAYLGSMHKHRWQCSVGHVWDMTPSSVKSGQWCPLCFRERQRESAKTSRLGLDVMHSLAKSHGGECLSKDYKDNKTKLLWKCSKGHVWKAAAHDVKQGYWCLECYRLKHRERCQREMLGIKTMQELAIKNGGNCLSREYHGLTVALEWQCKCGNIWEAKPRDIRHGGHWCPICGKAKAAMRAKSTRLGMTAMKLLAKKRGGLCLSKEYVNTRTKLRWQCAYGHEWMAVPSNVKNGSWCPTCSHKKSAKNLVSSQSPSKSHLSR